MQKNDKNVLVTGSAGAIGRIVCRDLTARGYAVRGLDLSASPDVAESIPGTISDPDVVRRSLSGMSRVIHLAATPDEADFMSKLLPNNIVGVYNVLEAARESGAERVVLASSIQVANGLLRNRENILREEDGVAPDNLYGVTKIFAEMMGQAYARRHNMNILAARIGWFPRTPAEMERVARHEGGRALYLSHNDAARFFACALEHPFRGYAVVYVTSRRPGNRYGCDLDPAKQAVGYEPQDVFPSGVPEAFEAAGRAGMGQQPSR